MNEKNYYVALSYIKGGDFVCNKSWHISWFDDKIPHTDYFVQIITTYSIDLEIR